MCLGIKEFLFVFFVCIHVILVPARIHWHVHAKTFLCSFFVHLSVWCHAGFLFFLCTCIALSFILLSACGFEGLRYAIIAMYSVVFIYIYTTLSAMPCITMIADSVNIVYSESTHHACTYMIDLNISLVPSHAACCVHCYVYIEWRHCASPRI